jgi:hypothetical protein
MRNLLFVFTVAMLTGTGGLTAADRAATARDLFYNSAAKANQDPEWLGIRTSILYKYTDRKNQLRMAEVSDLQQFRDGDKFRLRVQANTDGYLYLFLRNSRGETQMLFPYEKGTGKVSQFRSRFVPEKDWFAFDRQSGTETLYLILSPDRLPEIDRLINGDRRNVPAADLDRWVGRVTGAQSMLFDEESLEDAGDIGATYFVEKPGPRRGYLVRRFELVHNRGTR